MSTVYVVKPKSGAIPRLIEAKSAAAVMAHIYSETNEAPRRANREDLAAAIGQVNAIEKAAGVGA